MCKNVSKEISKKKVVLLSGGVDSTTCLAYAVNKYGKENVIALCMSYGQKHKKEIECARQVANYYNVKLIEQDLSKIFAFSECTLLEGNEDIEHGSYKEQLDKVGGKGTVSTYVPFRNGLFLASATAIAISVGADGIMYGAHADDAAGRAYPDCTPEFETAMNLAIFKGSGNQVCLQAPLLGMNKTEVVKLGLDLEAPYHLTWSCYEGGEKQCGTCGTCIDRRKAFENNGVKDPVGYSRE